MLFSEQQYLSIKNILSYRTRVDITRLNSMLIFADKNIDAFGLEVVGKIMFTAFETVKDRNRCILGIEVLIPVNKAFESCEKYVYKPEFRLINAVSGRFSGPYSNIGKAEILLKKYLSENSLRAISSTYYVAVQNNEKYPLNSIYDAYVSVDGNIL